MDRGIFGEKVRPGQITDRHAAFATDVFKPDERNFKIVKALGDVYSALANKLFENNPVMEALILSRIDTMNIYNYPVCGKCETVGLWHESVYNEDGTLKWKQCGCMRCGAITKNPATVLEWLKYELKRKVGPDYFGMINDGITLMARSMMKTWLTNLFHAYHSPDDVEQENGYSEEGVEVDHTKVV